ncbi:MAG: ABC transporter permease, partial [Pseudomonadota bacterium]
MRSFIIGAVLAGTFLAAALLSFLWTPFDVTELDIAAKLQTSSGTHWLGTDHFGRDLVSMIMVGARISLA